MNIGNIDIGLNLTPDRIIFLLIVFVFLKNGGYRSFNFRSFDKIHAFMFLFIILCLVSYFVYAPDKYYGTSKYLITIFYSSILPFSAYYILRNTKLNQKDVIWLFFTLFLMGIYLSTIATFEHYKVSHLIVPKYIVDPFVRITQPGRAGGPFLNGGTMGRVLIATFLATLVSKSLSTRRSKTIFLLFALFNISGIYFTNTRGPWLAFAISLIVFFVLGKNTYRGDIMFISSLMLLLLLSGIAGKMDIFEDNTLFQSRSNTIDYRILNYKTSLNMGISNPIFGIGYGMFNEKWREYLPNDILSSDQFSYIDLTDGNHNTFLGIFSELGLIGVIPYLLIMILIFVHTIKSYRKHRNYPFITVTNIFVITYLLAFIFTGQFADLRFQQLVNNILFIFFGVTSSLTFHTNLI